MRNFQRIASDMDITPLLLAINTKPRLWREDTYLRDFPQGPFGEIESIMLRFPVKSVHDTQAELENHLSTYDQQENVDYPAYKTLSEARPLIMWLMSRVAGERLGRCMINKIAPGGRIFPHVDTKSHTDYYSRFHIVLQSNPDSHFRAGTETVNMPAGDIWWFDNAQEHEVINAGTTDRIHLVVDIRTAR
ncbi:aspartyl/asparaginyl beta-hydroxylase domain-containing protein [Massilia sp. TSP1-1-2]|uniref:aspartyl/asparaginyl beta-hydroxylase domain-containing protein n=1 Tax=Massilia sp. TSP1-1-2 TaxID=2804649 RepID=UPI003CF61FF5